MSREIIVKVQDKPTSAEWDYNSNLEWLWSSDKERNWDIYSTQKFTRFWDVRVSEPRSR